jgi:hypothetical protein
MSAPDPTAAAPPPAPLQFSLRTIFLVFVVLGSSLAVFGGWGIIVFALVFGLATSVREMMKSASILWLLVLVLCTICLIGLLLPSVSSAGKAARREVCATNLHQILLALYNYEEANGHLPPAYVADKNGKPIHSWRALILPYLDLPTVSNTYDFTEPWDGPKNKKLLTSRPFIYVCPDDVNAYTPGATQTSYVAVVGSKTAWSGTKPRKLADVTGGTGNTVMIVEVANSGIAWTEPRDLSLESLTASGGTPVLMISSNHHSSADVFFVNEPLRGANVALADGSVCWLSPDVLTATTLWKHLEMKAFVNGTLPYGPRRLNWPNILALAVWLVSVGLLLSKAARSRKTHSEGNRG